MLRKENRKSAWVRPRSRDHGHHSFQDSEGAPEFRERMCEWSWGREGESKRALQGLGKVSLQGHDGFTFKVKLAQGQEQENRGAFCS